MEAASLTDGNRKTSISLNLVLVAIIGIVLTVSAIYLYMEKNSLQKRLSDTENSFNKTIEEKTIMNATLLEKEVEIQNNYNSIANLTLQLAQTQDELKSTKNNLAQTQEKLSTTNNSLEQMKADVSLLEHNLTIMKTTIEDSMSWFKSNSYLTPSTSDFASYATTKCIKDDALNLGCVAMFMEKRLGFKYSSDSQFSSIDDMVARGWGDCKDYSLYLKALLNTLANENQNLTLLGWKPGYGQFTTYETSAGDYWYYSGVAFPFKDWKLNRMHPYVMCYAISGDTGHCLIALSNHVISSVDELDNLESAMTFEPQTGEYTGDVGTTYHLCGNEEQECWNTTNDISVVITDDDIYLNKNGQWESFGAYKAQVTTLQTNIAVVSH